VISEEERKNKNEARRRSYAAMSEEQRERIREALRRSYAAMSEEQRERYRQAKHQYHAAMPEEQRERRRKDHRETARQYCVDNPERLMLVAARKRAKKSGMECSITIEDIVIPDRCPIDGLPLERGMGDRAPSLDRIDNSRGYVPGNVAVISKLANTIKNSGTALQHEQIAAWMRGQHSVRVEGGLQRGK
jgi:hypothetical protein